MAAGIIIRQVAGEAGEVHGKLAANEKRWAVALKKREWRVLAGCIRD